MLNVGSYNYLGFAENTGPCADAAADSIGQYGLSSCSPRTELGLPGFMPCLQFCCCCCCR
jgi:serine palmitoyltransferase